MGASLMNFVFFWRPAICISIMYFAVMFLLLFGKNSDDDDVC